MPNSETTGLDEMRQAARALYYASKNANGGSSELDIAQERVRIALGIERSSMAGWDK